MCNIFIIIRRLIYCLPGVKVSSELMCLSITNNGDRCQNMKRTNSKYCKYHSSEAPSHNIEGYCLSCYRLTNTKYYHRFIHDCANELVSLNTPVYNITPKSSNKIVRFVE
jgi:hypothetical protein